MRLRQHRLRIDPAAEIRACLNLFTVGANGTKIGFVVDHDVDILRHDDVKMSNINMRPVRRVARHREPAEIDRQFAKILRVTGEWQLCQVDVGVA